jgi:hypothetical protein
LVNNILFTVTWHAHVLKSSHINSKINDESIKWLEKIYDDTKLASTKATRGKINGYCAMKLDFAMEGKLNLDMTDSVKSMVNDFPGELSKSNYPWNNTIC